MRRFATPHPAPSRISAGALRMLTLAQGDLSALLMRRINSGANRRAIITR